MDGDLKERYPIGARVKLEGDSPDEEPREVEGYRNICGTDYLIFADGYMAFVGRVAG